MSRQSTETSGALIGKMRESTWTLRSIASVVILTFGGLVTAPAVAAVKQEIKEIQWHKADGNAAKLSKKVEETHAFLTKLAANDAKSLDLAASHEQLHALKADLDSLDKGAMDEFAANEAHIKAHKLPAVIEQRQQDAVKMYRDRMDTLMAELKAADAAKDATGFMTHVAAAKAHLDKVQVKPFHEKFDPKNLPFSVAKPTGARPRLTRQDYKSHPVAPPKRAQVAANGPLTGILTAADVTGALPTNPADPSYVAPTDDVQITPAIQAQAAALHNDPVQIYNWVHNNIEYIPTYGSIQGSDMTLQTLKGNDFDQASLLIALLRASNIPSRYVYGTIQVPIAQVENWVGGVTDPNAALNLMSQGGIPVTGLVQGGQIKYAQVEHVWVEAWVNYIPSLAARPGPGNTWIPLDASFKQYTYTQGMDLQQAVPFDATSAANQLTSGSQTSQSDGWVSNINSATPETIADSYQSQVQTYIASQKPNATFGDVIGTQSIKAVSWPMLAGSLPYSVVAVATRLTALPDNLAGKMQFNLYASADDQANSTATIQVTQTLPSVAGKRLALSFLPATAADAQLIASYVPALSAGTTIDPTQLPSSLPGYLIHLTAVFYINGSVVGQGGTFTLGQTLVSNIGVFTPQTGWDYSENESPIAGEYHAIALDLQGISVSELSALQNDLQSYQNQIASSTLPSDFNSVAVTDAFMQSGVISWFAFQDAQALVVSRNAGVSSFRQPSFGSFSTTLNPIESYGVVVSVGLSGETMNITHSKFSDIAFNNDSAATARFNQIIGMEGSLNESQISQQLFNNGSQQASAVSAVSALILANQQGQRIYTITGSNLQQVLPNLNLNSDVINDITNAVSAGMTVTVPQNNIINAGWTGTGYIIADPTTGSGAYRISGGANGASFIDALGWVRMSFFGGLSFKAALLDVSPAIKLSISKANFLCAFSIGLLEVIKNCAGSENYELAVLTFTIITLALFALFAALNPVLAFVASSLLVGPIQKYFITPQLCSS